MSKLLLKVAQFCEVGFGIVLIAGLVLAPERAFADYGEGEAACQNGGGGGNTVCVADPMGIGCDNVTLGMQCDADIRCVCQTTVMPSKPCKCTI